MADRIHRQAYRQALQQSITPDTVVVDIGTGTGILALLSCRYGARRVYAIESDDAIQVARELAAANGYADRIEFIQALSTQVTLPEPVQVIVSDIHGVFPVFEQAIPSIIDARRRFLAPGGILIPQQDTLWAAVAAAPEVYREFTSPWNDNDYGLNMEVARLMAVNSWQKARLKTEQLLAGPRCWCTLDYSTVESPDASGGVSWVLDRPGTAHGLVLWFDSVLIDGVTCSNAPGLPETVYGHGFFPWPQPVDLKPGDEVSVGLSAHLVGEDYIWSWDTRIFEPGRPGELKAFFQQSTFCGASLSTARLQQRTSSHVPTLHENGRIDCLILELMDGGRSLGEIAREVTLKFPQRFARENEALGRVRELSLKYGCPPDSKYLRDT